MPKREESDLTRKDKKMLDYLFDTDEIEDRHAEFLEAVKEYIRSGLNEGLTLEQIKLGIKRDLETVVEKIRREDTL